MGEAMQIVKRRVSFGMRPCHAVIKRPRPGVFLPKPVEPVQVNENVPEHGLLPFAYGLYGFDRRDESLDALPHTAVMGVGIDYERIDAIVGRF